MTLPIHFGKQLHGISCLIPSVSYWSFSFATVLKCYADKLLYWVYRISCIFIYLCQLIYNILLSHQNLFLNLKNPITYSNVPDSDSQIFTKTILGIMLKIQMFRFCNCQRVTNITAIMQIISITKLLTIFCPSSAMITFARKGPKKLSIVTLSTCCYNMLFTVKIILLVFSFSVLRFLLLAWPIKIFLVLSIGIFVNKESMSNDISFIKQIR